MALPTFTANTAALAADMTNLTGHLTGGSGKTEAWHFRVSTSNNFLITLSEAAGATKFSIRDSAQVEVFSVNSDGDVTVAGAFAPGVFTFPTAASPSQTDEGKAVWDTDDDRLTIGTGSATKVIGLSRGAGSDASATQELVYDTTNAALKVWNGSTSTTIVTPLSASAQQFVESSGYKGFFGLGLAHRAATGYAAGAHVGLGWAVVEDATSAAMSFSADAGSYGAWKLTTGATANEDVGFVGPLLIASMDWTMVFRGIITSAASQNFFCGARTSVGTFADENGSIGFRVDGTGNVIGFVDNAGTETTRDTGATGATEATYRIEVRSGGTIVRFYKNNVQIGADVTTNIPTGTLVAACGIVNTTTASKTLYIYDLFGWMEV